MVLYEIYVWTKRVQTQIALSEFLQLNYQFSYSSCIRGSILQYEYSKMIVIITTCIKLFTKYFNSGLQQFKDAQCIETSLCLRMTVNAVIFKSAFLKWILNPLNSKTIT